MLAFQSPPKMPKISRLFVIKKKKPLQDIMLTFKI